MKAFGRHSSTIFVAFYCLIVPSLASAQLAVDVTIDKLAEDLFTESLDKLNASNICASADATCRTEKLKALTKILTQKAWSYSETGTPVPPICPVYQMPQCPTGQHIQSGAVGANGCPTAPTCVADGSPSPNCPVYQQPLCPPGAHVRTNGIGDNGCPLAPSCISNNPSIGGDTPRPQCTPPMAVTCPEGTLSVAGIVNQNGCLMPNTCIPNPQYGGPHIGWGWDTRYMPQVNISPVQHTPAVPNIGGAIYDHS